MRCGNAFCRPKQGAEVFHDRCRSPSGLVLDCPSIRHDVARTQPTACDLRLLHGIGYLYPSLAVGRLLKARNEHVTHP
jgi:hypothetical protein